MTNYMQPFWERRLEDLDTARTFAERQLNSLTLKALGQMAIPIEALLDQISAEESELL